MALAATHVVSPSVLFSYAEESGGGEGKICLGRRDRGHRCKIRQDVFVSLPIGCDTTINFVSSYSLSCLTPCQGVEGLFIEVVASPLFTLMKD